MRVASYNIRHGVGSDGRLDLSRTAAAITALDADVIGLQEVDDTFGDRSGFEDQTARLAELTGMHACFGATLDRPAATGQERRRRYGLALLSRHEIVQHEMYPLPGHPGRPAPREPRGLLHARVQLPDQVALTVLVTHLDNEDPGHRTTQVLEILRRADGLDGPAILVGDMNADPSTAELAPLGASGWRDAATGAKAQAAPSRLRTARSRIMSVLASFSLLGDPARAATFSARLPLRRIDSIWVRAGLQVTGLEVVAARASDHRSVVATLRLAGRGGDGDD